RGRESQPVDDVVEAALQQLQQRLAGDAAGALRRFEVAAELVLEHPVDALHLLLLAQLQAVAHELRLPQLSMLPRRQVALLDRALLGVAALSLQKELHAFAPAQPTNGSNVTCHSLLILVASSFQFPVSGYQCPVPSSRIRCLDWLLETGNW